MLTVLAAMDIGLESQVGSGWVYSEGEGKYLIPGRLALLRKWLLGQVFRTERADLRICLPHLVHLFLVCCAGRDSGDGADGSKLVALGPVRTRA